MSNPTPSTHQAPAVFLGMKNQALATVADTDGTLSVTEVVVSPGAGAPPHTNQREAITWYVLEGSLTFLKDGAPTTLSAGELIFMPANRIHTFANQTEHPARALMICTPGGFEQFFYEVADALPDDLPSAGPPPAALDTMQQVASGYGLVLHLD